MVLGVVKQSLYDSNQLAQRATREGFWAASYRAAFRVLAKVRSNYLSVLDPGL